MCTCECVLSVYVCAGVFLCHVCDLGDMRAMCVCVCAHVACVGVCVHICAWVCSVYAVSPACTHSVRGVM